MPPKTSSNGRPADRQDAAPAEVQLLAALRRHALPIVLVTGVAAMAGFALSRGDVPLHPVRSELLVRIGYEYTPVPAGNGSESQPINFRAEEVIGTEIQLVTSVPVVEKALQAVPYPGMKAGPGGRIADADLQSVQNRLAVKQLEGSNVILVEVTDANAAWAEGFLDALVKAYLADRARLFSQEGYGTLLEAREAETRRALAAGDAEMRAASKRIGEAVARLTQTVLSLSQLGGQNDMRRSLASDIRGLQIYVATLEEDIPALSDALAAMQESLALEPLAPALDLPPPRPVPMDGVKADVDQIGADVSRLALLRPQQAALQERLDTIRAAKLRKEVRDEVSRTVQVVSPPHRLATANGVGTATRTVMAGLIGFILATLAFVYLEGTRRAQRRRPSDA